MTSVLSVIGVQSGSITSLFPPFSLVLSPWLVFFSLFPSVSAKVRGSSGGGDSDPSAIEGFCFSDSFCGSGAAVLLSFLILLSIPVLAFLLLVFCDFLACLCCGSRKRSSVVTSSGFEGVPTGVYGVPLVRVSSATLVDTPPPVYNPNAWRSV